MPDSSLLSPVAHGASWRQRWRRHAIREGEVGEMHLKGIVGIVEAGSMRSKSSGVKDKTAGSSIGLEQGRFQDLLDLSITWFVGDCLWRR